MGSWVSVAKMIALVSKSIPDIASSIASYAAYFVYKYELFASWGLRQYQRFADTCSVKNFTRNYSLCFLLSTTLFQFCFVQSL
jgi:hypothetical protein